MLITPNILSIFRICLVPLFALTYFSGIRNAGVWAFVIYVIASLTDMLDGYIARRFNLITDLGKVLDPLGDKLLTFCAVACLSISGILPGWILIIFICKELMMGLGGILVHKIAKSAIPPSNYWGKTATMLFSVTCAALILFSDRIPRTTALIMICICLAVSLAAFASYIVQFRKIMKECGRN